MSTTDYIVVGVAVVVIVVAQIVNSFAVWQNARAAQAWGVAIGQAQLLSGVAVATAEDVNMRRGERTTDDDEDPPNRSAHTALLDEFTPADLINAARQNARRQPPPARKTPREWNANDNATAAAGTGADVDEFDHDEPVAP